MSHTENCTYAYIKNDSPPMLTGILAHMKLSLSYNLHSLAHSEFLEADK